MLRLIAFWGLMAPLVWSQTIAIRAGRLFDPKSGTNSSNQVVLVRGERIMDVGPAASVTVPAGARVIDLSNATVLPGLIDGHVHTMGGPSGLQYQMLLGVANAQRDLNAGFTTVVDMGSHGGWFGTVELKKAIDSGLVKGPRMQVSGPVLSITKPLNSSFPLNFKPAEADLVADGVEGVRAAVRELAHYGATWVKLMVTGTFVFKPNGEMVNEALPSLEEIRAVVDEAHRRGMKVASHSYGDNGLHWSLEAGIDWIQHAVDADEEDIKIFVRKDLPLSATILDMREDEPGDLKRFAPYSRLRLMETTWKKMLDGDAAQFREWGRGGEDFRRHLQMLARRAGGDVFLFREVGSNTGLRPAHGDDSQRADHRDAGKHRDGGEGEVCRHDCCHRRSIGGY